MNLRPFPRPARPAGPLSFVAAALGLALLGACGQGPEGGRDDIDLADVPAWRIIREVGPAEKQRIALQCGRPWRVRFRVTDDGGQEVEGSWRALALGQSVRIWFAVETEPEESFETDRPSPEDVAAGRTQPQAALLSFQFHDRRGSLRRFLLWSRPGKGSVEYIVAAPPGTYEPVRPAGTAGSGRIALELATIALTDLAEAKPRLRYGETRNRLTLEGTRTDSDLVRIVRLYLDLEPVGADGSDS